MIDVEMHSTLNLGDGSPAQPITIKIHDLRQEPNDLWSVAVDVVGFKTDDHTRAYGQDWLNALEGATILIRELAGGKVKDYGATITPTILPP